MLSVAMIITQLPTLSCLMISIMWHVILLAGNTGTVSHLSRSQTSRMEGLITFMRDTQMGKIFETVTQIMTNLLNTKFKEFCERDNDHFVIIIVKLRGEIRENLSQIRFINAFSGKPCFWNGVTNCK